MNSAPVTLPCTSSTTATGAWPARATPVKAMTPIMAEKKRFIVQTSVSLPIIPSARRKGDILYPAGQLASKARRQRESYHTSRCFLTPVFEPKRRPLRAAALFTLTASAGRYHHHALVL